MRNFELPKHSTRALCPGKIIPGCKGLICTSIVLLIATLCFLPGLGSFGLLDPTDSFFIEAAREMRERHHYITALYNYTDWLDKPILSFLPIVVAYKLFGVNTWAARLPAALCGIILVVATYVFARCRLSNRTSLLCTAILCSSPLFLLTGHVALADEVLSMFFGVAMLFAGITLSSQKQKMNMAAYVFLALAILTKGPIPLILALGTIAFYLLITSATLTAATVKFWQLRPVSGAIILLTICLPYFYWAHVTTDGAFTVQFFLRQNVGRMLGTVNHQEPIWFYIPIILGGYFPWILYLLLGIPWFKKLFARRQQLTRRQGLIVFCVCWVLWVLLLFTFVPTKLPTYIVPLSPALAILVGTYLSLLIRAYMRHNSTIPQWFNSPATITIFSFPSGLAFVGSLVSLWLLPKLMGKEMSYYSVLWLVGTLSPIPFYLFWRRKFVQAIFSLAATSLLICAIMVPCALSWFYQSHQVSINKLVAIAKARSTNLATLFSEVPSVVFAMQKPVPEIKSLDELEQFCKIGKEPHLLLATRNCLQIPQLQAKQHIIANAGKWYLLDVEGYPW